MIGLEDERREVDCEGLHDIQPSLLVRICSCLLPAHLHSDVIHSIYAAKQTSNILNNNQVICSPWISWLQAVHGTTFINLIADSREEIPASYFTLGHISGSCRVTSKSDIYLSHASSEQSMFLLIYNWFTKMGQQTIILKLFHWLSISLLTIVALKIKYYKNWV